MEAKLNSDKITLPIGTTISLKMIGKNRKNTDVNIISSEEASKFYAIFEENDVDFEILIDNSKCDYGIGYTLIINEDYYDYYVGPRETWNMETLYSNGRKLHFISQNTDEGKLLVAETADKHNLSYSEASAICSKIEFIFEVEIVEKRPVMTPEVLSYNIDNDISEDMAFSDNKSSKRSNPSSLGLMSLSKEESQRCLKKKSNLFGGISSMISSKKTPKPKMLSLSAAPPEQQLVSANYRYANTLSSKNNFDEISRNMESSDVVELDSVGSLAQPFPSFSNEITTSGAGDRMENRDNVVSNNIGEKGVICFGEQSNQIYSNFGAFAKDDNLTIKPFTIEMRMSSHK